MNYFIVITQYVQFNLIESHSGSQCLDSDGVNYTVEEFITPKVLDNV